MNSQLIENSFLTRTQKCLIYTNKKPQFQQLGLANKFRYRVGESNPSFLREREAS
jgi:hypothetical protein